MTNRRGIMAGRTPATVVLAALLTGVLAAAAVPLSSQGEPPPESADSRPLRGLSTNTILVVVDDMRDDEMAVLPDTRRWLTRDGVRFSRAYAPTSLCCPARATLLTGQYAHNTGVYDNTIAGAFPGGFETFDDTLTLATVLDGAGVTTGYVGKYLNGHKGLYIPPGWDDWRAGIQGQYHYRQVGTGARVYEGLTLYNINGTLVTKVGYETSVQTNMAAAFIRDHAGQPFFLMLNYLAPHGNALPTGPTPPSPHESHEHDFDGYRVPRTDAVNEADVTDKAQVMQRRAMTAEQLVGLDDYGEVRLETLQSVDDGLRALRTVLHRRGILDRTNVMFMSDNGFMLGEHRWPRGKNLGYEPSSRVPLLMTGPGVARDRIVRSVPVGLHDIASTVTTWFGLGRMPGADGVPLVGRADTGRDILLQGANDDRVRAAYTGLRTQDGYKYLEYRNGDVELFDLTADPLELTSLADDAGTAQLRARLADRLALLRGCAGATCR